MNNQILNHNKTKSILLWHFAFDDLTPQSLNVSDIPTTTNNTKKTKAEREEAERKYLRNSTNSTWKTHFLSEQQEGKDKKDGKKFWHHHFRWGGWSFSI